MPIRSHRPNQSSHGLCSTYGNREAAKGSFKKTWSRRPLIRCRGTDSARLPVGLIPRLAGAIYLSTPLEAGLFGGALLRWILAKLRGGAPDAQAWQLPRGTGQHDAFEFCSQYQGEDDSQAQSRPVMRTNLRIESKNASHFFTLHTTATGRYHPLPLRYNNLPGTNYRAVRLRGAPCGSRFESTSTCSLVRL